MMVTEGGDLAGESNLTLHNYVVYIFIKTTQTSSKSII